MVQNDRKIWTIEEENRLRALLEAAATVPSIRRTQRIGFWFE
jgi:hypothetical protein